MTRASRRLWLILLITAIVAAIALRHFAVTRRGAPSHPGRVGAARNLVLVTIDTCRADRVGRGLTPTVDALAARGLSFTNARTVAPLTLPAHVSLMTGLFPPVHGVRENGTYRFDGADATLARVLRGAGYRTAAFVAAYVLDRRFGLNDGFDLYDDQIPRDPDAVARLDAERRGDVVADRAIAWLRALPPGNAESATPFFLWVHFYDPHAPYSPPPAYLEKAHGQPYDGEVAFADAQLGRVLAALGDTGQAASTLVVVAGDHGESLGEHGETTHGMLLFEATVRVPLVLAGPGIPHRVRDDTVSLVEVAPTLLRLLGQALPARMTNSDLAGENQHGRADVYSETLYPRTASWSPVYSLVEDRWKLLQSSSTRLFDLQTDPSEQHDVAAGHQSLVRNMSAHLAGIRDSAAAPDRRERPSAEVAERLRALGYVAGTATPSAGSAAPDPATVIGAWSAFEDAENALAGRQYKRAVSILKGLVDAHPDAAVFESSYATAVRESGDRAAALAAARRSVERHPGDATAFHGLAVAARDGRRLDEALRAEQAALALDPGDPGAHNGLGLIAVDRDALPDAVAAFARAVELDPTNAQYWTNLGNARRASGDLPGAEQAYRRALDIDGTMADAANGVGVLLVQAGRSPEAIAWFERALAGTPDFYEARLNLGIACQQAGDLARAARTYREVLQAPARFTRERDAARKLLAALR
jgi:arylsulfatase A-like enzyme/Flp pilus assembly protein TadD